MAMALCCPANGSDVLVPQVEAPGTEHQHAPINFLYGHLHDAIRTELRNLSTWALQLEASSEQDVVHRLLHLKERYHFLEQVYKYHSSVEDEVVYPALDTKVKNVTSAYSVEHQDEEYLFEHLGSLLASALAQDGAERGATVRKLICKIEEIHITLRKHLAKEEAQLLPLLLQHFSHAEQAELVAQFMYCIPLDTVETVLSWLRPMVPLDELQELMQHLRDVIPDRLLLQLLVTWLNPAPAASSSATAAHAGAVVVPQQQQQQLVDCPLAAPSKQQAVLPAGGDSGKGAQAAPAGGTQAEQWPPLRGIVLFHHSIRGALEVFTTEAAALQQQSGVTAGQLAGLVERHRFLRSVCMFHTLSEEEVMFPEVLRISGLGASQQLAAVSASCSACCQEHGSELLLFEDLGRLLADVRAFVRRGRTRDVSGMVGQLVDTSRKVCSAISAHMQREEAEVLPLLAATLTAEQQRGMVWHTLRAMPLRLLERVLPWLLSKLSPEDAEGMMLNLRLGAPQVDQQLVELLLRWAHRGRWPLPEPAAVAGAGVAAAAAGAASADVAAAPAITVQGQQLAGSAATQQHQQLAQVHENVKGLVPASVVDALCKSCGHAAPADPNVAGASPHSSTGQLQLQDLDNSPTAVDAEQQRNMHDPCYFSNNTCELRLITRHGSDICSSPRKRQRLCESSSGNDSSSADVTPTAAQAAEAAAAAGVVGAAGAAAAGALLGSAAALACAVTMQGLIAEQQQPQGLQQQQQQQQMQPCEPPSAHSRQLSATTLPSDGAAGGSTAVQLQHVGSSGIAPGSSGSGGCSVSNPSGCNPIDHIFQFHKALRCELKELESDAAVLELAVLHSCEQLEQQQAAALTPSSSTSSSAAATAAAAAAASSSAAAAAAAAVRGVSTPDAAAPLEYVRECSRALQQLDGRFQFLWGIYRAHSKAEDEIVFPALESKEALHNVSHAYTLDHEQEEQLFHDLAAVIGRVKASASATEARELVLQLRRMCAAVRASLETHVRAEEAELWPLFSEHFSTQEQQHLVGVIIGRTGAEVLQTLLPWVTGSFNEEEKEAMMGSLREATKNTMFDQWLGAVQQSGAAAASNAGAGAAVDGQQTPTAAAAAASSAGVGPEQQQQQQMPMSDLAEIAEYLAGDGSGSLQQQQGPLPAALHQRQCLTEVSGTVAESTNYVPGWEDIFNINQKQLEAAIRRVSNDPNLEPQRKAYLIQNIMVSRYIVAQQRRLQTGQLAAGAAATAAAAPAAAGAAQLAAGQTLPPPAQLHQQHQQHSHAHVHAAGGCCHHHAQQDMQQHQQQHAHAHQQQQVLAHQSSSSSSLASQQQQQPARTYADAAAGVLGCKHYRRSAQLVAPCCGKVYTCRLCHDDASDHRLDRYAVAEMVCMLCGTRQPVGGACCSCGGSMAGYYCGICHLFDDEPGRDIYHCPFCNVCRRGKGLGVDFFHCMQCNACMSLSLFNSHTCRERAMEGNCPVCHEYLFDSAAPIKELPCGHFLHSACFAQYARYAYTCPICCKSIGDMSMYFRMLDSLLASERRSLPAELASKSHAVLCQDCGRVGQAPYHFVYHKCPSCSSYNTRVM